MSYLIALAVAGNIALLAYALYQRNERRYASMRRGTYFATRRWQGKRVKTRKRAGGKCQLCGKIWQPGEPFDTHHNTYDHWGNEPPEDLIFVCRNCHEVITFQIQRKVAHKSAVITAPEATSASA